MTEEGKKEIILATLREQIQRGDFGIRGRIPTISQLAKTHQVARTTVYQVLEDLQIEGILISKDNSYYVNYPPMRIPGAPVFDKYKCSWNAHRRIEDRKSTRLNSSHLVNSY